MLIFGTPEINGINIHNSSTNNGSIKYDNISGAT